MNAAGALYRDGLARNHAARSYLRERGIPDWVVRACGLGYADGRSLEAHLRKHGGLRVAEDLGLLRRPESGEGGRPLRERFAGRVVIPEIRGGQPIWFIGRRPGERWSGQVPDAARRQAGPGLRARHRRAGGCT